MVSRSAISVLFRKGSFFQENGRPARGLMWIAWSVYFSGESAVDVFSWNSPEIYFYKQY
jgi:hypothetical protein